MTNRLLQGTALAAVLCGTYLLADAAGGRLSVIGDAFIAPAHAQNQGLTGGGKGQGSGGTTGGVAGPRGAGSGGSTAGAGTGGGGGTSSSTGPGSVNQNRYGGSPAPVVPPDTPSDPPAPPASTVDAMQYLNGEASSEGTVLPTRCTEHVPARQAGDQRIAGRNLQLLEAAQSYLAPAFDPGDRRSGVYLIAHYQEELEGREPDAAVAGSYLGMVSTISVTPKVVGTVNAILCVTSSARLAREIAAQAEATRQVPR